MTAFRNMKREQNSKALADEEKEINIFNLCMKNISFLIKERTNTSNSKSQDKHKQLLHRCEVPLKADAPDRAIPYPIKTAAGLTKRANAVELAVVNSARALALPVAVVNQSTASLNKNGT